MPRLCARSQSAVTAGFGGDGAQRAAHTIPLAGTAAACTCSSACNGARRRTSKRLETSAPGSIQPDVDQSTPRED
eukprot:6856493-Prymnesium_polylepis.3